MVPGWHVRESTHFQLQTPLDQETAARVLAQLEWLAPAYAELLGGRPGSRRAPVKLFAERDEMAAYDPEGGDDAWFDAEHRELVAWDTGRILGRRDRAPPLRLPGDLAAGLDEARRLRAGELLAAVADDRQDDAASLLGHEGWHLAVHEQFGRVQLPAWLEEGLGDHFGARRPAGDGWRLEPLSSERVARVRRDLASDHPLDLPVLLALDRDAFYAAAPRSYAWADLLVRWLLAHPDPPHRALVPRLLARLKRDKNPAKATQKVFGRPLEQGLEQEFLGWVASLEPIDPMARLARELGDVIDPDDLQGPQAWVDAYARQLKILHDAGIVPGSPLRAGEETPGERSPGKRPADQRPPG